MVWNGEQKVIPKSQERNIKGITPVAGEGVAGEAAMAGHALI